MACFYLECPVNSDYFDIISFPTQISDVPVVTSYTIDILTVMAEFNLALVKDYIIQQQQQQSQAAAQDEVSK